MKTENPRSAGNEDQIQDVIVVGSGLSGLSCAFELAEAGVRPLVLEAQARAGGRTSSWVDPDGMVVESGLHRVLGVYSAFPDLLKRAGLDLDRTILWEDEVEFRQQAPLPSAVIGAAPLRKPMEMLGDVFSHNDYLPPMAKLSLAALMTSWLAEYAADPAGLDQKSVLEFATERQADPRVISHVLEPLVAGIYFVPAGRLSAYVFAALIAPYLSSAARLRVGAFAGGMTTVMMDPLAAAIRARGGEVLTRSPVDDLVVESGRVAGVRVGGTVHRARHVVLASSVRATQTWLRRHFGTDDWLQAFLGLPTMPAVTLQLELDRPSMAVDRTTFGVGTALACFSEQKRTTFREKDGRLSIILAPSDELIGLSDSKVLEIALEDADKLGLTVRGHIKQYRVVSRTDDFYSLAPGNDHKRPPQETPVPGLSLAGDYTKQKFVATMEGAVVSGRLAAEAALKALKRVV